MDFRPSEKHHLLAESLRRYFSDNHTVEGRGRTAFTPPFHCETTWRELADLGIVGAFASEEFGGLGGSAEDVGVVFEEIGRALCAEPLLSALMALHLLERGGRSALAANVMTGALRVAVALYEPETTCDLATLTCEAIEHREGWRLTGRKSAIYGGSGSKFLLIAARTGAGLGLYLAETPSLIAAPMADGGATADLVMDGLEAELVLADAQSAIEDAVDLGRIALCAEAVGAMSHLIQLTTDYLTQRKQFGRSLGSFQALQHRVVDLIVELEQARSITIRAVSSFGGADQARHVAMAKNLIGRAAALVAEEAIQLHGGIGMTWEYAGSHYAKRLIMIDHQLGDRYDQALRLAQMQNGKPFGSL